jgi:hypothetical protein
MQTFIRLFLGGRFGVESLERLTEHLVKRRSEVKGMTFRERLDLAKRNTEEDPSVLEAVVAHDILHERHPNPEKGSETERQKVVLYRYAYNTRYGIPMDEGIEREARNIIGMINYSTAKPLVPTNRSTSMQGKPL